jgi:hypothetical protein
MQKPPDQQTEGNLALQSVDKENTTQKLRTEGLSDLKTPKHAKSAFECLVADRSKRNFLFFYSIATITLITFFEIALILGPFPFELRIGSALAVFGTVKAFTTYLLSRY